MPSRDVERAGYDPSDRAAPAGASANVIRRVLVDWGIDPYGRQLPDSMLAQNDLSLTGRGAVGSVRFGLPNWDYDDFRSQQAFAPIPGGLAARSGAANAVPTREGNLLAPPGGPPVSSTRDLLEEFGL